MVVSRISIKQWLWQDFKTGFYLLVSADATNNDTNNPY